MTSTPAPPIPPPTCFAAPGWYCTAASHQLFCPQDFYCPGGYRMPIKCPSGKWSAVGSMYIEDCSDHMNVELAVIIVLILMLFALGLCCWWSQFPYRGSIDDNPFDDRRRYYRYGYGACSQARTCSNSYPQPVLGVPMNVPYRYSRVRAMAPVPGIV